MAAERIEERLKALEAEVSRLRQIVDQDPRKSGWKKMVGAFLNDPYFEKAMKYGQQYRESLRPNGKKTPKKRKSSDGDS